MYRDARQDRYELGPKAYVAELSKNVLFEAKFKCCNPDFKNGKPCVYVGMTDLDPDVRFDKHKAEIQANSYVQNVRITVDSRPLRSIQPDGV